MGPPALGTAGRPAPALVAGGRGVATRRRRAWRHVRRRFMWRVGCCFVLLSSSSSAAWSRSSPGWSRLLAGGALGLVITAVLPFIVLVLLVLRVVRLIRRTGAPVGRPDRGRRAGRGRRDRHPGAGTRPAEIRSLARAFNAMSARLAANEEARRTLLADVSHELRTPLSVMQGTLEGVLDGVYPADEAHLRPVLDETRVLSRLIDDLRTLSLVGGGRARLHREPTDLEALLAEVVASQRAAADEAGVRLDLEVSDLTPILVDAARIRQVVANLVANALRFTPQDGHVLVSASDDGAVTIRVSDTGPGMEAEEVEHAFDRFYRSPGSSGSGLGLSIARNLVEAHGGHIGLESEPGKGTTVEVILPR